MPEIIQVKNLTKKFKKFAAVKGISFSVSKGSIFAFLGPNGAGKTTTIKMLTTLLRPSSGSMLIDGNNPVKDQSAVRKSFGIIFQDASLDDELTAMENLEIHGVLYRMPRQLRKNRIEELLKFVDLWDRKDDFAKHFSGGMKRRLEIARGLMHHPKVLFLDEPTVGLDPQTRNHIWKYLKDLNKKEQITVFFTTHYMEEAEKISDKVAIIDNGKIIMKGSPKELKKRTKSRSLEDAFLHLTGKNMRQEEAHGIDTLRMQGRMWGRR
jgi:ABC-2 type transport system ATP-binding protein